MRKKTSATVTRRDFTKAAAAAAISVPWIISASALGDDEIPAASDRLTLGFIGLGKQNRGHLGGFLGNKQTQVLAVCEVDTTRRESAQKMVEDRYAKDSKDGTYKGCVAYTDFRELLARKDIDAVVIATPDHWHAIQAIEACRSGKDIYCEKPLTLTIREAQQLIEAVRQHDRVFQTGSQQRSGHEFWLACSLVRSGRIGKVSEVIVDVAGPSQWCDLPAETPEPGLDWDRWLGPAPERPYNSVLSPRGVHDHFPAWRNYREYSGGMMTDWGAHHFDIAQWGLGMDESGPSEIIPPDNGKAERGVRFLYPKTAVGENVVVIHGSSGGVLFKGSDGQILVNRGKLESTPASIIQQPLTDSDVKLYKSPGHQQDWLNAIRERTRPICDVEVGARSVTVCHLGNLAYWHRKTLRWDPQTWQFTDPQEANEWRDRQRRDPWQLPSV